MNPTKQKFPLYSCNTDLIQTLHLSKTKIQSIHKNINLPHTFPFLVHRILTYMHTQNVGSRIFKVLLTIHSLKPTENPSIHKIFYKNKEKRVKCIIRILIKRRDIHVSPHTNGKLCNKRSGREANDTDTHFTYKVHGTCV